MIDDHELLLFHYRDGLSGQRIRRIEKRLEHDGGLRLRLRQLEAELSALHPAPARAPDSAHRRWRAALAGAMVEHDHARAPARPLPSAPWQRLFESRLLFAPVLAAGLLLSVGVFIATRLPPPGIHAPAAVVTGSGATSPSPATVNAVQAYLVEAERRLVELDSVDPAGRAEVLADIRQRNALYVKAAERAGWSELARVLRAFDLALSTLQDDSSPDDADRELRSQLEFELNALQTRIGRRASKHLPSI